MGTLMSAMSQWMRRPADERFASVKELYEATTRFKNAALSSVVNIADLLVVQEGEEIRIRDKAQGGEASLSNWSFRQLCRYGGAPANYMQDLEPRLVAECLNAGLRKTIERGGFTYETQNEDAAPTLEVGREAKLLLVPSRGERYHLRAITGPSYTRIWNAEIASRLLQLHEEHNWRVPPARPAQPNQPGSRKATKEDVLQFSEGGIQIQVGDLIAPAGLYASDHDMFAFLVNDKARIDDGSEFGLGRGMFVTNSEVGAGSLVITRFLYRGVCGNHIVWGASQVKEVRIRHVGMADERGFQELVVSLKEYAESSAAQDTMYVKRSMEIKLGKNRDEVIAAVLGLRVPGVSRRTIEQAYDTTESYQGLDGDPKTPWGIAQGITRISQENQFADQRTVLDRAAGVILAKTVQV